MSSMQLIINARTSARGWAHRLIGCCFLTALLLLSQSAQAFIPASERQVLLDLYNGTNGPGWTTKTNWNGKPRTECGWFGVACDAAGNHVTQIRLNSNNLVGTLPASLNSLTALQIFLLNNNHLTGTLPPLTGLTALEAFEVFNNQLSGSMPELIGLTALSDFLVSGNQLTGAVPALTGLTALVTFDAYNNQLSGGLPVLTNLMALRAFSVDHNHLSGSIPALTGLPVLTVFSVSNNQLTGRIPVLAGSPQLKYVYLSNNNLIGNIPELNALAYLFIFTVDHNQLTGSIPSFSGLTALQSFYANDNQLTGNAPDLSSGVRLGISYSGLCPNLLNPSTGTSNDAAWNTATGVILWSRDCTVGHTVGGTIDSLTAKGLILLLSPTGQTISPVALASGFRFAAPLSNGTAYNVMVQTQPGGLTCTVSNGAGTMGTSDISSVSVSCAAPSFAVTGVVSPGAGGTVSCTSPILTGNTSTCTVTVNTGYFISSISGCGGVAGSASPYTTGTISADCSVAVSFGPTCLDIDGDGQVSAARDGELILRYLAGFTDNSLTQGIETAGATRTTPDALSAYMAAQVGNYSLYGPTVVPTATREGLILLRLMRGAPDAGLLGGIDPPPPALPAAQIRALMYSRCGSAF